MDWKEWFEKMSHIAPKVDHLEYVASNPNVTTVFWEDLYQNFKARYEEERASQTPDWDYSFMDDPNER